MAGFHVFQRSLSSPEPVIASAVDEEAPRTANAGTSQLSAARRAAPASTPLLVISVTPEAAEHLRVAGPRRDFLELARATGGELCYRPGTAIKGLRGKLFGPHVRQAWDAAAAARGRAIFADGEHVGIPLLFSLALRRKRVANVVMLGHLVSKPWKLALLTFATRLGSGGTLVLHSVEQQHRAARWLGRRWRTELVPYQVDTDFWQGERHCGAVPLVLAVGSENRDYQTLVDAVSGLPVSCLIAAGSHWARSIAAVDSLPPNVEYRAAAAGFEDLRELYLAATVVVVPLKPVPNQSGITTLLEAMSTRAPVIVTATPGQRECVQGALMRADGTLDAAITDGRGPGAFGLPPAAASTGIYVPPGDAAALRAAILRLTGDAAERTRLGDAAGQDVRANFGIDAYVSRLAALLGDRPSDRRQQERGRC